jgi:putative peptidoglycan lipid II flippase
MLLLLLQRKIGLFLRASLFVPILKVVPACLLMTVAVYYVLGTTNWTASGELLAKGAILLIAAAGGAGLYLGCCYLFKVDEIRRGWQLLRTRKSS